MKVFELASSVFILLVSLLSAGSVRLMNDSPYKLRVVVRSADGTFLGEMTVNPHQSSTWSDAFRSAGNIYEPAFSQTPYSVLWYCMNGDDYAFCDNVASGSMVVAQSCDGARICKPVKKKKDEPPPSPEEKVFSE